MKKKAFKQLLKSIDQARAMNPRKPIVCVCGHEKDQHDQYSHMECFGGPMEMCACKKFTLPKSKRRKS